MRIGSHSLGATGIALCLALCLPMTAAADKQPKQQNAVPLTAGELYQIYHDKTWVWGTGGGRFDADGRRFVAFTNDKGVQYFAEGTWTADDFGQLCMRATWTSKDVAAPNSTCFGHRRVGNTIYQRRQPAGPWYIFRHARVKTGDEYNKLVAADTVSAKVHEAKLTTMAKN